MKGVGAQDDSGTKIVMLLDSSGSMNNIRDDVIGSVNSFVEQQQKQKLDDKATFSLAQFDSKMRWIWDNVPLAQVKSLVAKDYVVNGGTALLDSIGDTIARHDNDRDVVLVICTDGQDNESRRFSQKQIKELLARKKADAGWDVIYLSCDEAGFAAGHALGVGAGDNLRVAKAAMSSNISYAMSSVVCNKRVAKSIAKSTQ